MKYKGYQIDVYPGTHYVLDGVVIRLSDGWLDDSLHSYYNSKKDFRVKIKEKLDKGDLFNDDYISDFIDRGCKAISEFIGEPFLYDWDHMIKALSICEDLCPNSRTLSDVKKSIFEYYNLSYTFQRLVKWVDDYKKHFGYRRFMLLKDFYTQFVNTYKNV